MTAPPRAVLALALAACGEPISNAALLEDGRFLSALPGADRWSAPAGIADAPDGPSPTLAAARRAARDLDARTTAAVAAGQALADALPDARTDVHRAWDAVAVPVAYDGAVRVFWTRAVIVLDADRFAWSIEGSADPDGTYTLLGAGSSAGDLSAGQAAWDGDATRALLGEAPAGTIELGWQIVDERREVVVTAPGSLVAGVPDPEWHVWDGVGLGFWGPLRITDDDVERLAVATAVHVAAGGRAAGAVGVDGQPVSFGECWTPEGLVTWRGGEPPIHGEGDEAACALPAW